MLPAPRLSALTGAEVYVKYENLQVTNSFKERGALNKLASLTAERAQRAASSPCRPAITPRRSPTTPRGSSIPATIVMPVTTPIVKVEATQAHGASVVLEGETVAEAQVKAEALARERGLTWVHPYDDVRVIAGQGTIAPEMLEDVPDLDMLVIPIGGGGLIAGNAIAARALKPSIEVVGAEAAMYPSFWNALTGEQRPIGGPTLAEGIAVKNVGKLTLPIVRELVSEIVLVDEESIERAVNAYLTLQKTMAEGAGAAGLAAMLAKPERFRGRKVGLILCGGNIDPRILVDHRGARARARMPHRLVPAVDSGPPGRARADRHAARRARRQHPGGRSPPALPQRAGQGRQARRHRRDPRPRAWRRDFRAAQARGL